MAGPIELLVTRSQAVLLRALGEGRAAVGDLRTLKSCIRHGWIQPAGGRDGLPALTPLGSALWRVLAAIKRPEGHPR